MTVETQPADTWSGVGYHEVTQPVPDVDGIDVTTEPNVHYGQYIKMHKVFVGSKTAGYLEDTHARLRNEFLPHYLSAAGWAAAEAALVHTARPEDERLQLFAEAKNRWREALINQRIINQSYEGESQEVVDHAYPYRIALDLAVAPLIEGIIRGDVSEEACRNAFQDCLNVAEANIVQLKLAADAGNVEAIGQHYGFAYECNALLALNRNQSSTWFAIPSIARADTGHHHRQQTHDLLVVHQRWGTIINATPVEIKSRASRRDRLRYKALLVRGKMHLSDTGHTDPDRTLQAIAAVYSGQATQLEQDIANKVTHTFMAMIRDYRAGEFLGGVATRRSATDFHDNRLVAARHPGLATNAA